MTGIAIQMGTRNGKPVTKIRIGDSAGELPRHLLAGEKMCGYTVRKEVVEPWHWLTVSSFDGERHIICDPIDIMAFTEIAHTLRPQALALVRELASALLRLPAGFVHPAGGFIETWRIFFIREGGFLILPEQLSQVILLSVEDEDRKLHHLRYLKPQVAPPFGLCHQCAQFLYLAATGIAPYASEEVKGDRWRHVPLSLGFTSLDERSAQWIDHVLSMSLEEQQQQVSAAYSAEENLSWFLEQSSELRWDLEQEIVDLEQGRREHPDLDAYLAKQAKRARVKKFWRTKGALVISLAFGFVLLTYIGGSIVMRNLEAPYTAGMSAPEVISEFFEARNALDAQKMGASLARGAKNPFESEVTALFVNSRVRKAYGGSDALVRADEWVALGMPPVDESSFIYGLHGLSIEQTGPATYRAHYQLLVPTGLLEEETAPRLVIEQWSHTNDFTLSERRGYWEISRIDVIASHHVRTLMVETSRRTL